MGSCRCEGELLKIEKMLSEIKEKKKGGGGKMGTFWNTVVHIQEED